MVAFLAFLTHTLGKGEEGTHRVAGRGEHYNPTMVQSIFGSHMQLSRWCGIKSTHSKMEDSAFCLQSYWKRKISMKR